MKSNLYIPAFLLTLLLGLQSCSVVGGIFKAGAVTGIIAVVVVVALIIFIIMKVSGNKK
jgi:uncharacterized membrane protein